MLSAFNTGDNNQLYNKYGLFINKLINKYNLNKYISTNNSLINKSFNYDDIYNDKEVKNECIICGVDMGPDNPRQLCFKTFCPDEKI